MLRFTAAPLFVHCRGLRRCAKDSRPRCAPSFSQAENKLTVDSFQQHSADVQKIRKLEGWVLFQSTAYVENVAALLRDLGADGKLIAHVLEQCPEAVLCSPEEVEAQTELWTSVCSNKNELLKIITMFPSAFFTRSDHTNQMANIRYFRGIRLNKRIIRKLMAAAPQSFSNPVEKNHEMIHTLKETYMSLGGSESNMKIWLQKIISQNPFILLKSPRSVEDNVTFLRDRGFSSKELLQLLSRLRGLITELNPDSVQATLEYCQEALQCSQNELKEIILKCPSIIYYSVSTLADRLNGLLKAGVSLSQIKSTPTILELTTQIVMFRIQKLRSCGYDVRTGSLESVNGTKKDFEKSYGRLQLREERPLFNPVIPLKIKDD
ncbi:hypothetical protein Z043_121282 [Scleropages formosus]|uniref:Uncharacterized protein n=1 Tax=Scleropages formosus TaxID=113540 RepID=A0A0P7Y4V9_SCLFO|nr:hypothetical protein Z043_121282 [Scleropages formosus]